MSGEKTLGLKQKLKMRGAKLNISDKTGLTLDLKPSLTCDEKFIKGSKCLPPFYVYLVTTLRKVLLPTEYGMR